MPSLSARRARGKRPSSNQLTFSFDGDQVLDDIERWLPVPDWPGYEVSSWGRVHSYRINRTNSKDPDKPRIGHTPKSIGVTQASGHRTVHLCGMNPGEERMVGIHALVLEAFKGPCPPGLEACHDDGNPGNNRLDNLDWGTRRRNFLDRLRHGTSRRAKLKVDDIQVIWGRLVAGEAAAVIARDYGVTQPSITNIRTGRTWSHITSNLPGWPLVPPDRNAREPVRIPDEFAGTSMEIWRPIPDWPAYRISNFGNVQSLWKRAGRRGWEVGETWREISPTVGDAGRLVFYASNGRGKPRTLHVHLCVLIAFAGPAPPGMIGCHDDDDPRNNHASNLRWDTYAANARDRVENAKKMA